ncbi:glycerol-3-phosphate dehydrogenase/oxidase [Asaia bogorensis]|uniref:glycerol-3-phosphate dehydrogenase/oxidase n=1 Tax=Asaia bogorensis TaxID=91915 RepID=UPI002869F7CC|nr:glycerol-3-phosphate dehydrogenase/oxidase [Asaia bogorensis]
MLRQSSRKKHQRLMAHAPTAPVQLNREVLEANLSAGTFDILIVGGGVTGAYCAFDAALRGYKVALVEQGDFASGTSSKSSKMVHGGLRYIEQGNIRLVAHALLERQRLRRNARHLVHRLPFLFPVCRSGAIFDARLSRAFDALLWIYDLAGGWREGILHKRLSRADVLAHCPTFRQDGLTGGLLYYDARVDDARLTLGLVRSAAMLGAIPLNYARVSNLRRNEHGAIDGADVVIASGDPIRIRAKTVVMATGVWLRDWQGGAKATDTIPHVRPAKGVHVAVPWIKIRNDCTLTIPIPGTSRRASITRWGDISYIGTTDTDYSGPLDQVVCNHDDLVELLEAANNALDITLTEQDVVGTISGCRPLVSKKTGGSTADIARDHVVHVSKDGMVTIVGGKMTTSRHMAEQTIDAVARVLGSRKSCSTRKAFLLGAAGYDAQAITATGGLEAHLAERYGTESRFVSDLIADDPSLAAPLVEGLPYARAEAVFALRHEMATSVDDILSRRTRARFMARDASARAAQSVGTLIGRELSLPQDVIDKQVEAYRTAIEREKSALQKGQ